MDGLRLERRDATGLGDIRQQLLDVYAEIYADRLGEEFHSVARFDERLGWNTEVPGFAAVVCYLEDTPVGYAYGCTLQADTRWWNGLRTPVAEGATVETGARTFALSELMIVDKVRGSGAAQQIHDELLRGRPEERVTLLVERDHPKVRALYEAWGYEWFGEVLPFPDAPLYDAMVLPRTPGS
ncbi:N-acetyltransferase [Streptomyces himalayensis]|uniref:N-acetyltransferase n=1 Tax=Streptomyces himalayensis subsp. himalayensis TaxID=2756131 RepID=A0A7W0I8I1_9ACTN|nr:N-acetyltransferase [Streptomyces himalayensis]MBA2946340.1 N-acetyltransferase [Streptomyces himalayensis subsp. himalayensis]